MGKGAGIPTDLKIKIARHFEDNGYTKKSRLDAQSLYKTHAKSDRFLHR